MDKINFYDLQFFANHFNMKLSRLSWCILEEQKNGIVNHLLGIKYDGSKVVISVEECCLRRLKRGKLAAYAAVFERTKRGFRLKTEAPVRGALLELIFTKRDLENLYRDKWYDERLR